MTAIDIPDDLLYDDKPTRKPGDFLRQGKDGAPYVKSLTKTRKRQGLKADLIAQAEELGIDVPDKVTVPQLHDLLGPEPAWELYGRPSNAGSALDPNPYRLIKHKERQLLIGASILDETDRDARWPGLDFARDDRDALDKLAARCHQAAGSSLAADRGTHIHLLLEHYDNGAVNWRDLYADGEALGIPESLQRKIMHQWAAFRKRLGVTAIGIEQTIVHDRWRLAGTLDRHDLTDRDILTGFGIIEAGTTFIGDIKTGSLTLGNDGQPNYWVKFPVQLAAYADGVPYDVETDERGEW